jgi:hypothetical protein
MVTFSPQNGGLLMATPEVIKNLLITIFLASWIGGAIVLATRARRLQRIYYSYFPEIQFKEDNPFAPNSPQAHRALWNRSWQVQQDPMLEAMRHEIKRRYLYYALWIFVCPVSFVIVAAILSFVPR